MANSLPLRKWAPGSKVLPLLPLAAPALCLTLTLSGLVVNISSQPALAQGNPQNKSNGAQGKAANLNGSQEHFQKGRRLLLSGQLREALREFDRAVLLAPGNVRFLTARGACRMRLKDFEGAYRDFNQALLLHPENADLLRLRGTASMCLCEADRAIQDLSQAITIAPTTQAIFNRATCYVQTARYEKAIADYSNLIKTRRNLYASLFQRGRVYYLLEQYDKAIVDFTAVIKADPNSAVKCYICRGRAFAAKGRTDLALADLKKAVLLDGEYAESFYAPAVEALIESDADEKKLPAAAASGQVNASAPARRNRSAGTSGQDAVDKQLARALTLKEKKQLKEALAACDSALETNAGNLTAHVLKGKILMEKGDYKGALACFNQAWSIDNLNTDAITGRVEANLALGLPLRAMADLGKLVWASPDDPGLRFQQGQVFDRLKREEQAQQCYRQCLQLDRRNAQLIDKLGKDKDAYFRTAQATKALSPEQKRLATARVRAKEKSLQG